MKFNYAETFKDQPEHFQKFSIVDKYLEQLAHDNPEEFSKEMYFNGQFAAIGVGKNDIIYTPHPAMSPHIEQKIRKELKRLYPSQMNYKEAEDEKIKYSELTTPQMVASEPPHLILDCIIAPKDTPLPTLQKIYTAISEEKIYNQDVLIDMGLLGNDMRLFMVYQMKGLLWIDPMERYSPDLMWTKTPEGK